jgi:hypothetical protein
MELTCRLTHDDILQFAKLMRERVAPSAPRSAGQEESRGPF